MWTIKLLRFNQVPSDFREPFIMSGYRSCRSSLSTCLFSAVQRTNETLNFWTHFAAFFVFAWLCWQVLDDQIFVSDPFSWPFLVYLISACTYMVASAAAHLFNCMSESGRHICFFFDYGALSIYSLGCSIGYFAYIFPPELMDSLLYNVYFPMAIINSVLSTITSCSSRLVRSEVIRVKGRLLAFLVPYLWCSVPLFYRVIFCEGAACDAAANHAHIRQFLFALVTALFYATRFPEVLAPGVFDIIGHSHQLFHVCGVIATYNQFQALLTDMTERREYLLETVGMPTFLSTFGVLIGVLIADLLIIWGFSYWVRLPNSLKRIKENQGIMTTPSRHVTGCGCR